MAQHIKVACPLCKAPLKRLSPEWAMGWLAASDVSMRETARRMGISPGYLNDMLHGRKVFTEEMEQKFLTATNGSVPRLPRERTR